MAKRLTLEEKSEKKFPLSADLSDKEISSILAMRKAWIKVEQVRAEEREKKKRQADKKALALGKSILKEYPDFTLADLKEAEKILEQLQSIAERVTWVSEKKQHVWNNGAVSELYALFDELRGQ